MTDPASGASCAGQDLHITRDAFNLVIEGECGQIVVTGSQGAINVDRAAAIRVDGSHVTVLNAQVGEVVVTGHDNTLNLTNAGTLTLDSASHQVSGGGVEVALGPTEYRLLEFFMRHPDRVYSRAQLLDRVWGGNVYVEERTVDVHIRRLRKALTPTGHESFIRTVRGSGYRFSAGSS